MLATQLEVKYKGEKCAIVALSDGGVMVGAQIAMKLHCVITLLASADIMLPREPMAIAGITAGGTVAYNHAYSDADLEEFLEEYYRFVEGEKLVKMHDLNRLLGDINTIDKNLLRDRNIILVSDGLKTGFELDLASEFLKPVSIEKLVVATPLASVKAVDRMHVLADDLYCLDVVAEYMDTDHYYDTQDVPDHQTVLKTIEKLMANWK